MSDTPSTTAPATRSTRTFAQAGFTGLILELLLVFNLVHWTPEQIVVVMGVATAITTYAHNWIERYWKTRNNGR